MPNKKKRVQQDEEPRREEEERPRHISAELQKLIDNPNLNQAGNERGSHDEPQSGSQTGADID